MPQWDDAEHIVPLAAEHLRHAEYLAAEMMSGILLSCKQELSLAAFARMAMELAMELMNESRTYVLCDGKVMRKTDA